MDRHAVIDFIEDKILLGSNAGKLFKTKYQLLDFQKKIIQTMFDFQGNIVIPNLYLIGAKKTSKTDMAKLIIAYRFFDPERFGENHTVSAMSHFQASFLFDAFREMCEIVPEFSKVVKINKNKITHKENKNTFTQLYQSKNSVHGIFPSGIQVFDECGAYDKHAFSQMKIIQASTSLANDPQQILLANIPETQDHYSLELLKQARKDKDWQVHTFQASKRYSWKNIKAAETANPFLLENKRNPKRFVQVRKWYEKTLELSKRNIEDEVFYKRYGLGLGTLLDSSQWIDPKSLKVIKDADAKEIYKKENITWAIGIDLSLQGSDATAWSCVGFENIENPFDDSEQNIYVFGKVYYSQKGLEKKPNHIREKLEMFAYEKDLVIQNASTIQMQPIIADIYEFLKDKDFKEDLTFVFDPTFASAWIQEFSDNFRVITRPYMPKEMTAITRIFQRQSQNENIFLLEKNNKAVRWQASCGEVNERSKAWCLLQRLNKNKDINIDFWVASLLAGTELLKEKSEIDVFVA